MSGPPTPDTSALAEVEELPAGADLASTATIDRPGFLQRAGARRRLRYLRRVREIALRDLGGLVYDLDRFGRTRADLVRGKLGSVREIDDELHALEIAVDDVRPITELRAPGIASCASCGELAGSEARFCPACGRPMGAEADADTTA